MWEVPICTIREDGPSKHNSGTTVSIVITPTMRTLQQIHITDLPSCSISPLSVSHNPLREQLMTSELSLPASRSTTHTHMRYVTPYTFRSHSFLARVCGLEKFSFTFCIQNQKYRVRCTVTNAEIPTSLSFQGPI
jgi:hypothetical protein